MHLLRYAVQRSLSHTNPSLTRTTLLADFDSMWRGSALFSIAAGHRLDVLRGEVEERIAERQTRQRAASKPQHSESSAGISDLRKQLRKPVAAASGKPLACICEVLSADSDRSLAPQHCVSRLVARSSGAGRLTAFWAVGSGAEWHSATRPGAFLGAADARQTSSRLLPSDVSRSHASHSPAARRGVPLRATCSATSFLSFE